MSGIGGSGRRAGAESSGRREDTGGPGRRNDTAGPGHRGGVAGPGHGHVGGPGREGGRWRPVGLIARRELLVVLRSRAFRILTVLMILVVVVGGMILRAVNSGTTAESIALAPGVSALGPTVRAGAAALAPPATVTDVTDEAGARTRVADGELDVLLTGTPTAPVAVVRDRVPDDLSGLLQQATTRAALAEQVQALGGDPAQVETAVAGATLTVQALDPTPERDVDRTMVGYFSGLLIFIALMMSGQLVAQGVVEEKTSRVVELLLSTVRPWQLMAGKVLGIGAAALAQIAAFAAAAVLTARATGMLDGQGVDLGSLAIWLVVWFVLGYAMYAVVLAALASLVSRQEDVGSVITPVLMMLMLPWLVSAIQLMSDPSSRPAEVLSLIPLFSPLIMPQRIALGVVPVWEIALTLGLTAALVPVLVYLAGRIYGRAVLQAGARMGLREALRR